MRTFLISGAVGTFVLAALLAHAAVAWVPLKPGADAPGPAVDPGAPGAVGVTRTQLAGLDALVWYPADPAHQGPREWYPFVLRMDPSLPQVTIASSRGAAREDAPWAPGISSAPLVVLSPGFALRPDSYAWLAEALAADGYVVVAPDHGEYLDPGGLWRATVDRPRELSATIDAVAELASPGGVWEGRVDASRVVAVGHSYGGYAAQSLAGARIDTACFRARCADGRASGHPGVALCDALEPRMDDAAARAGLDSLPTGLWPSWRDERVVAVVSIAGDAYLFGEDGLAQMPVPALAIGGDLDTDTPLDWGSALTAAHAGGGGELTVIAEAGHMDFLNAADTRRRVAQWMPGGFLAADADARRAVHADALDAVRLFLLRAVGQTPG